MHDRPDTPRKSNDSLPDDEFRSIGQAALDDLAGWFPVSDDSTFKKVAEALKGADPEFFSEWIERLTERMAPHHFGKPLFGTHEPFPLDALPPEVTSFVEAVARARCVDVAAPAAMSLVALASAIGLSRVYHDPFAGWKEVPVIWLGLVASSGWRKTPVVKDLFARHVARQDALSAQYEADLAAHEREMAALQARTKGKRGGSDIEPTPRPPELEHVFTSDSTAEAMSMMLASSPRGILCLRDELAGFFSGMGQYKGGGKADADRPFWLSLFSGEASKIDRVGKGTTFLRRPTASVAGAIQPDILKSCFDAQTFASGLAARFLLVMPDPQIKVYSKGPSSAERAGYDKLIDRLFELEMEPFSEPGGGVGRRPAEIQLADDARPLVQEFVPDWSEEAMAAAPSLEAAMSKLEGYALRFALILRVAREVLGRATPGDPVSREDVQNGIRLARWFKGEAVRVYRGLGVLDDGDSHRRRLMVRYEVIRTKFGGAVTVREWRHRNTRRTTRQAKAELEELVQADVAGWQPRSPGPKGGAPTTECALLPLVSPEGGSGLRVAGSEEEGGAVGVDPEDPPELDEAHDPDGARNPQPTTAGAGHDGLDPLLPTRGRKHPLLRSLGMELYQAEDGSVVGFTGPLVNIDGDLWQTPVGQIVRVTD